MDSMGIVDSEIWRVGESFKKLGISSRDKNQENLKQPSHNPIGEIGEIPPQNKDMIHYDIDYRIFMSTSKWNNKKSSANLQIGANLPGANHSKSILSLEQ